MKRATDEELAEVFDQAFHDALADPILGASITAGLRAVYEKGVTDATAQ